MLTIEEITPVGYESVGELHGDISEATTPPKRRPLFVLLLKVAPPWATAVPWSSRSVVTPVVLPSPVFMSYSTTSASTLYDPAAAYPA